MHKANFIRSAKENQNEIRVMNIFLRRWRSICWRRRCPPLTELECLLPWLQKHDIETNSEPPEFTKHSKILLFSELFNIILQSKYRNTYLGLRVFPKRFYRHFCLLWNARIVHLAFGNSNSLIHVVVEYVRSKYSNYR